MFSLLRSLLRHRRLVKDFVIRDLKARYVGSSMGFFWSVVFPVINLFVFMFVFRLVLKARWGDQQGALEVAVVMLAGIVVWGAFAETISRSTNSLVDNANLIQKVVFPSEVLPVYLTISSLINMCVGLPVVLLSVLWIGYISKPEVYLYVPHHQEVQVVEGKERPVLVEDPVVMNECQKPYRVHLYLTRARSAEVRVPFTLSGTAVEGEDYRLDAREAVIASGYVNWWLYVTPIADEIEEEPETIVIELGEPRGARSLQRGTMNETGSRRLEMTLLDPGPDDAPSKVVAPATAPGKHDPAYHPLALGSSLLALPFLFVVQVVFTVGLGFFLAAFNLFLRDTFHLVGVGITVWMFATPIFYPGWMVSNAGFGWILAINPMHWLIDAYRNAMLHGLWPQAVEMFWMGGAALLSLFLGASFFRAHARKFPDLL